MIIFSQGDMLDNIHDYLSKCDSMNLKFVKTSNAHGMCCTDLFEVVDRRAKLVVGDEQPNSQSPG